MVAWIFVIVVGNMVTLIARRRVGFRGGAPFRRAPPEPGSMGRWVLQLEHDNAT
jgi:hypothetical protein